MTEKQATEIFLADCDKAQADINKDFEFIKNSANMDAQTATVLKEFFIEIFELRLQTAKDRFAVATAQAVR
ncbi:MAG: hypothetical protein FWD33_01580 [Alphaproteobacteria bacterium]|nr:hypothetical protein [Alphaproteobacteria bacterium]